VNGKIIDVWKTTTMYLSCNRSTSHDAIVTNACHRLCLSQPYRTSPPHGSVPASPVPIRSKARARICHSLVDLDAVLPEWV